jgi:quinoprotein glucose dehydrogenase
MNKRANIAIATLAGLTIVTVFQSAFTAVGAQGKSVTAGVFTAAQATRGAAVYKENCSFCHSDDLKGSDVVPALNDNAFWGFWSEKSVGDLFEKINTAMPATAPGSLTVAQTADVIAHILNVNKFPAGSAELSTKIADLKPIMLAKPTP